jgi:quercetin dioxygenase-like cupin family protein/DNA-binding XRE family transcriptional regulator
MVEGNMTGGRRTGAKPRRRPLVGGQIRRLRTDRGLTLARVGELTGLNVGYLSQVETDKASPSLETLAAVADALEVPLSWLLVETVPPPAVVRRGERRVSTGAGGVRIERVDGGLARTLRIVEVVAPPGLRTELHADPGEEHNLLLEGRLRLRQGEHAVDLESGDYLLWDGSVPHEVENIGDGPARTLIITTGPAGLAIAGDGEAPARDEGASPS